MVQMSLQNSGGKVFFKREHGTPNGHQREWKYLGDLSVKTKVLLFLTQLKLINNYQAAFQPFLPSSIPLKKGKK